MNRSRADDELMLAFAAGDTAAFDALYDRYRGPLYRYLFHAVGNRAAADDLYQDVWSRIIDGRTRFRPGTGSRRGEGFRRWAFRIAHNRLVDHWRSAGRSPGLVDVREVDGREAALVDDRASPDESASNDEQAERLRAALMQLPADQREAFLLQQEAGLSLADIAERGGVGRETIKSRLRYATGKLRRILSPGAEAAGK
jgi:RNA polymerase sigma-70 factor (ECF subfamily)